MTEVDGDKEIQFGNQDWSGGFMSVVDGVRTNPDIHRCYINNVECFASEARFGCIVYSGCKVKNIISTCDDNMPH
jgi:hypothetical protein